MKFTLTKKQSLELSELSEVTSVKALERSVNDKILADFQTLTLAKSLVLESCIISLDTGLGKTLIAAGLINILRLYDKQCKWIYICQCSNLKSTYTKMREYLYDTSVEYCDATERKILDTFFTRKASTAEVIMLSYEALTQPNVESFIFRNRDKFKGVIVDESQTIAHLVSHQSRLLSLIVNNCKYKYLLTATPLTVSPEQFVNQVYMVDRELFSGESMDSFMNNFRVWEDGRVVSYRNLDVLGNLMSPRVINVTRKELGIKGTYTPRIEIVNTFGKYSHLNRHESIAESKVDLSGQHIEALIRILNEYKKQNKKGLVYANRNSVKKSLKFKLVESGFKVDILDGTFTNTQTKKDKVHQNFNQNKLDVVIQNICTGKDMPCDFIIFYEQTCDYKQFIGRGERGLQGKDMDIVFILGFDTEEIEYFYKNVYRRGIMLEELCGKDLSELKDAVSVIEDELKRRCSV